MKILCGVLFLCLFLVSGVVEAGSIEADRRALLSRVQTMSHGYHSEAEWTDVFRRLNDLQSAAARANRPEEVVELNLLEAMILADMRRSPERAQALLEQTIKEYYARPIRNLRRAYVQLSELHARRGDENAITELIRQFQQSPHFDPVAYPFSGGAGPDDPLVVTRPRAQGRDSITVTAMERFRQQARVAPGRHMPELTGVDMQGRSVRLSDLRGRVVLVDFWFPEWTAWQRELPHLLSVYRRYQPTGFEVIGIPLGRDTSALLQYAQRQGMPWPQWRVDPAVPARFGIFGDASNILIDTHGVIMGHNLRGPELDAALQYLLP